MAACALIFRWTLPLIVLVGNVCGQSVTSTSSTQSSSAASQNEVNLELFQSQQFTLAQSWFTLSAQNPSQQQITAWQSQNASLLTSQLHLTSALTSYSASQPLDYITAIAVPPNASPGLTTLIETHADLLNLRAQWHNQHLASPATSEDLVAFQQQAGPEIQTHQQAAQAVAAQTAAVPVALPPPLNLPPGITPELRALLIAHDQVLRSRLTFLNQYAGADAATRDAALVQWRIQNASLWQTLSQAAQQQTQASASSSTSQP